MLTNLDWLNSANPFAQFQQSIDIGGVTLDLGGTITGDQFLVGWDSGYAPDGGPLPGGVRVRQISGVLNIGISMSDTGNNTVVAIVSATHAENGATLDEQHVDEDRLARRARAGDVGYSGGDRQQRARHRVPVVPRHGRVRAEVDAPAAARQPHSSGGPHAGSGGVGSRPDAGAGARGPRSDGERGRIDEPGVAPVHGRGRPHRRRGRGRTVGAGRCARVAARARASRV